MNIGKIKFGRCIDDRAICEDGRSGAPLRSLPVEHTAAFDGDCNAVGLLHDGQNISVMEIRVSAWAQSREHSSKAVLGVDKTADAEGDHDPA
jgi:hypothetical protein